MDYPAETAVTAAVVERVKKLRTEARLSGTALAEGMAKLGFRWSQATVAKLEAGRRRSVSVDELVALANVLEVPLIWLLIDPKSETVPITEGTETDPWSAAMWMLGLAPLHQSTEAAGAWYWASRYLWHVQEAKRAIVRLALHQELTLTTGPTPHARLSEVIRGDVETLHRALVDMKEAGYTLPRLPDYAVSRARELGVELPGQED